MNLEDMEITFEKIPSAIQDLIRTQNLLLQEVSLLRDELKTEHPLKEEKPIGLDEVSAITGHAKGTLYKFTSNGEIPHYKKGKRLFFFRNEIIEWVKQSKVQSAADFMKEKEEFISSRKRK